MTISPIDTRFMSTEEQYNYAINAMRAEMKAYITEHHLKSLILGISGVLTVPLRPHCYVRYVILPTPNS